MPQKYNREEVRARVQELLNAGFKREWIALGQHLGMPESSLRGVLGGELPLPNDSLGSAEPPVYQEIAESLRSGPRTLVELANLLDVGPSTVEKYLAAMQESGLYEIVEREQRVHLPKPERLTPELEEIWPSGDELSLALAADFHFGSIYHQNTALRHFASYAADHGCEYCLVPGDITAGNYPGRDRLELYAYGADEQVQAAVEGLPEIPGLQWLLQGGNHDYTHYKQGGVNVVRRVCELRDDCTYVGYIKSDIPLAKGLKVRLWHPSGGTSYAKTYRGQKGAEVAGYEWLEEAVSEEEARAIVLLVWGHVHYRALFWYGPMMVIEPGCFQSEYPWLAAKALSPEVAGVVLKLRMSAFGWGSISEFKWLSYRKASDDFRPVRHCDIMDFEEVEPLFTLQEG